MTKKPITTDTILEMLNENMSIKLEIRRIVRHGFYLTNTKIDQVEAKYVKLTEQRSFT